MAAFEVYPAIDLRKGKVVRLSQGDAARQTEYASDPARVAQDWLAAGASWLHVVNLDGAFGDRDAENRIAMEAMLGAVNAARGEARVQFGGGLRTREDVERALALGIERAILGTVAVEAPEVVVELIARFGPERIGVGIDAREGRVRVRGWVKEVQIDPITLGKELRERGVRTVVFTNIARDGVGTGVDVEGSRRLAEATGLRVIASGGVASLADVRRVKAAGLSGVIIGRALYEGQIDLEEALRC